MWALHQHKGLYDVLYTIKMDLFVVVGLSVVLITLFLMVSVCSSRLQQSNMTLESLQCLLERRVTEHMEDCLQNPVFSMASNADSAPNLMMSCKVTDWLEYMSQMAICSLHSVPLLT